MEQLFRGHFPWKSHEGKIPQCLMRASLAGFAVGRTEPTCTWLFLMSTLRAPPCRSLTKQKLSSL